MIVWVLCGAAAGAMFATRFSVAGLYVFSVAAFAILVAALSLMHRLDADAFIGYALFCGAIQISYFATSVVMDVWSKRRADTSTAETSAELRKGLRRA